VPRAVGGAFHRPRLKIVSIRSGKVPQSRRAPRPIARLEQASALLSDAGLDTLLTPACCSTNSPKGSPLFLHVQIDVPSNSSPILT